MEFQVFDFDVVGFGDFDGFNSSPDPTLNFRV